MSEEELTAEAKSYSERLFDYTHIERLDDSLARRAIVEPALAEGIEWADDAVP